MRVAVVMVLVAGLLAGCGKKSAGAAGGGDPQSLFAAFDAAMKARQFAQAAAMIDFGALAAAANEDFDTFPSSQQQLIIGKMREDTVAGLAGWTWPTEFGAPQVSGDGATVASTDGSVTLTLAQSADGWKVIGGVPGMTSGGG